MNGFNMLNLDNTIIYKKDGYCDHIHYKKNR